MEEVNKLIEVVVQVDHTIVNLDLLLSVPHSLEFSLEFLILVRQKKNDDLEDRMFVVQQVLRQVKSIHEFGHLTKQTLEAPMVFTSGEVAVCFVEECLDKLTLSSQEKLSDGITLNPLVGKDRARYLLNWILRWTH